MKRKQDAPTAVSNCKNLISQALAPEVTRAAAVLALIISEVAQAQTMGSGLISYAQPIILFLGIGAIVVALVAAVFKPEIVRTAVWAAVILTVIFFILRNTSALTAAVSNG